MASLKDKVMVLTVASRGIGEATARLLAEDGPIFILCARTAEANAETESAVEAMGAVAEPQVLMSPTQLRRWLL